MEAVQVKDTLWPKVEDEVDDGEVGQEVVFVGKNLIIRMVFGNSRMPFFFFLEISGALQVGGNINKLAAFLDEGFVQVHQERPLFLIDGEEVVLQILEEGGVVVTGCQGVPMLMLPVLVVADAHVLHQAFPTRQEVALIHRHRERERPVGGVDGAAVAEGLFVEMLILLNAAWFARTELGEP